MRIPILLLFILGFGVAQAADIAGRYADKGTSIPSASGQEPGEMSLHAILQLDLEYARVRDQYVATDYVELRQGRATLEARMCAEDGTLRYHGAWSGNEGYSTDEDHVVLRLRGEKHGGATFACVLTLVGDQKLLQVEVSRLVATNLGANAETVGTYLFPRLE